MNLSVSLHPVCYISLSPRVSEVRLAHGSISARDAYASVCSTCSGSSVMSVPGHVTSYRGRPSWRRRLMLLNKKHAATHSNSALVAIQKRYLALVRCPVWVGFEAQEPFSSNVVVVLAVGLVIVGPVLNSLQLRGSRRLQALAIQQPRCVLTPLTFMPPSGSARRRTKPRAKGLHAYVRFHSR